MNLIIELEIKNSSDWTMLQPLLERLKIRFTQKNEAPNQTIESPLSILDKLNMLLDEGVDASYYGDPIAFQRDARRDTVHPLRD